MAENPNIGPRQWSPLSAAFVGDGVYDLLLREWLFRRGGHPAELHAKKAGLASAAAQAGVARRLLPLLTEEERELYRRGKAAKPPHRPRSATAEQYHGATGLEALFGFLYLSGREARVRELFAAVIDTFSL